MMRSLYVASAGLKLLASRSPLVSVSQSVGIIDRCELWYPALFKLLSFFIIIFFFFFFETEFCCCYPDWSAMARSHLTTTSASWVQATLPQPPE